MTAPYLFQELFELLGRDAEFFGLALDNVEFSEIQWRVRDLTTNVTSPVFTGSKQQAALPLAGVSGATFGNNQAIGTILNDDLPKLTINDVTRIIREKLKTLPTI